MSSTMLTDLPLCMVTLNPKDLRPISCNAMFEEHMGPLYRFQEEEFVKAASDKNEITPTGSSQKSSGDEKKDDSRTLDSRLRLREAIAKLTFDTGGESKGSEEKDDKASNTNKRVRVRDIEMTTLTGDSGFPVRRYFDWFISKSIDADNEYGEGEDIILLLGDPCTERDVDQREKDAELIDFFQNAPIALHWLTGDGKVLWANQTELNVLGYTAEEYIGKPIMNFCPDEQELVLEIFKQLGSGNAIRDVPVRFRTKDGKLVYLLIDSNIRYEPDGSFGHTRCFIRDDTGRKIREARASLLLEETKRSLKMLDNFMARSLHHMRTPLHVTQSMADAILLYLQKEAEKQKQKGDGTVCAERAECMDLCKMAGLQIKSSVDMLTDTEDLAKFDQGSVLHLHPKVFDIEKFGRHLLTEVPDGADGVDIVLELAGGGKNIATKVDGPSMVVTDEKVLKRVLLHLLDNAIDATVMGNVTLRIHYGTDKRLAIVVSDTGPGMDKSTEAAEGDLPPIFQRYHQELLPDDTADYSVASSIREKIEREINTHRKSKMGIGLSLSYHLVQELGGELRCTSSKQGTEFKFLLPRKASQNLTIPTTPYLPSIRVVREKKLPETIDIIQKQHDNDPQKSNDDQDTKSTAGSSIISSLSSPTTKKIATTTAPKGGVPTSFQMPTDILPTVPDADLAEKGIKSQDPPSVLIVEDTKMCAKMLTMILKKFGCSTKWVENGQLAVDELRTCTPGTYDLILMDLRMPVMDGLEATTLIKSELQVTTPVVALTGDFNEKTKQECEQIGFEDFRGKPMKRNDLKELIKTFTGYEVK
mmetsp:Transcript_66135/g.74054  ORF Transcript_66135/g.74054 Transcript_66135/m.74054 type:complete len:815 (-) Transcript_66135:241-2685(-)